MIKNEFSGLCLAFIIFLGLSWFGCESNLIAQTNPKEEFAREYLAYLKANFPANFSNLEVDADSISLKVKLRRISRYKPDRLAIAVLPPHVSSQIKIDQGHLIDALPAKKGGRIVAKVPRTSDTGLDYATCRFVLVHRKNEVELVRLSASTYPNSWKPGVQRNLEKLVGRDRKGLGGIPRSSKQAGHQIYDLGLSHATVNIILNDLVRLKPGPGFVQQKFEQRTIYVSENRLKNFDQMLARLRAKNIVASMILLVVNRRNSEGQIDDPLVHPEAEPEGKFAMPNLVTPEGVFLYRAIINELAQRFTRTEPAAGRVSNWIIHNEVDQSGSWTTMGQQPIERYVETYMRSSRIVHQATRKFDPHSRVFISLTHHWNKISNGKCVYRVREMIEFFNRAATVEGGFEWGIAYHPYPQDLRNPQAWNDDLAEFRFDTPLVTPRNIEVLPAFLDQPRFKYLGKHPRAILLSEQGCNARSMSPQDQALQAAGMVYMFNRMRHLPTVEAFHYHAYRDAPEAEGGMRLGLVDENEKPKFAWQVYQSFNTENEKEATLFAWPMMGKEASRQALSPPKAINK